MVEITPREGLFSSNAHNRRREEPKPQVPRARVSNPPELRMPRGTQGTGSEVRVYSELFILYCVSMKEGREAHYSRITPSRHSFFSLLCRCTTTPSSRADRRSGVCLHNRHNLSLRCYPWAVGEGGGEGEGEEACLLKLEEIHHLGSRK